MKIFMVSSEAAPFSKTGGLADVLHGLPAALAQRGHEVAVFSPLHRVVRQTDSRLAMRDEMLAITLGAQKISARFHETVASGVRHVFLEQDGFFNRDFLYSTPDGDYPDNADRFVFFSRAAMEFCRETGIRPDVLHAHDWQSALVPVYLKTLYRGDAAFENAASVLTVHNLGYQGIFPPGVISLAGLPFERMFTMEALEFYGKANLLKGGIVFADVINTVSPRYAREIQTEQFGYGLDGVLRTRRDALFGILNGVGYSAWNPTTDPHLAANYSPVNPANKIACKRDLLQTFGLPMDLAQRPLFGIVSRLDKQKGLDLLAEALPILLRKKVGFVLLGTGSRDLQETYQAIGEKYPDKAGVRIGFDEPLAHKIEAGADLFLMPSKYEPCGLNQMYSLKYGTIPLVRATGGLDDTVQDWNGRAGTGNGFKFGPYLPEALLFACDKAIKTYRNKKQWTALMANAFACDHSWSAAASEYETLYKTAAKRLARYRDR